jgi:hypothetical protein
MLAPWCGFLVIPLLSRRRFASISLGPRSQNDDIFVELNDIFREMIDIPATDAITSI